MRAEELLMNNLKYDFPIVKVYDMQYAELPLLELEAQCGHDATMCYELATRYRQGINGAPHSPQKAYEYYQKVLYSQRNLRAMYWLAELCLYNLPGMTQDALIYLKTADDLGDKDAAWLMGYIAFERADIAPIDLSKAYALFQRAKARNTSVKIIDRYLGRCAEQLGLIDEARKHYTTGLNHGDKVCANYLGFMYYSGTGVEENTEYAKRFFSTALESGDADAINYANTMLSFIALENGTAKERFDAFIHLKNNSNLDIVKLSLGKLFLEGIPGYLEKNHDEALKYFEEVPSEHCSEAFYHMASIYHCRLDKDNGNKYLLASAKRAYAPAILLAQKSDEITQMYVSDSLDEVVKTYNDKYDKSSIHIVKEAAKTDPAAMYELASRYRLGEDGVEKDFDKAIEWYRKVLWHQRNVRAMYYLGQCFDAKEMECASALRYWELAYSYGDADAAVKLGCYYEYDSESHSADLDKALQLYRFATEHGRKDGDSFIGSVYQKMGKYDLAETHFRRALSLDKDNHYIYCDMGYLYIDENNPKYNEAEAVKWFTEAANRGNEIAREALEDIAQMRKEREANSVPSVDMLLKDDEDIESSLKNKDYVKMLQKRLPLLRFAKEHYPEHPEVLRRLVFVLMMSASFLKRIADTDEKRDYTFNMFREALDNIKQLQKIDPTSDIIKYDSSFIYTYMAEMTLDKGDDDKAKMYLSFADHELCPWSSVLAARLILKQDAELESGTKISSFQKKQQRKELHARLRREVDIISKTVDRPTKWHFPETDRALGYYVLALCHNCRDYEPHIPYKPALAEFYIKKCAELNPKMAAGFGRH